VSSTKPSTHDVTAPATPPRAPMPAFMCAPALAAMLAALSLLGGCLDVPVGIPGTCGDGMHQPSRGEACDHAGDSATCDRDCTPAACGDGAVNAVAGETCDDANQVSGDGCSADCRREGCGDGTVDAAAGEACDDGNQVSGDGCSADCGSLEICGNGIVDTATGEECDHQVETAQCNADCTLARCGDGRVNPVAGEPCDTAGDSAVCDLDCTPVACGDGWRNAAAGEQCDDGNQAPGDGCSPACQHEDCGNGARDPVEQCDDGNRVSGDGCRADCGSDETCGNGLVDPGERCDDGNQVSGDGCRADCGSNETCGNGIVDTAMGEACDDGNRLSGDGCSDTCQLDGACGDGVVHPGGGEQCDHAGESATCDTDCTEARCGDGMHNPTAGEACDDAGQSLSCDADCTEIECGDGVVNTTAGEQCDDGGQVSGDGCSEGCRLEYCGNGAVDPGEVCDDGDQVSGDGCSADCRSDETCGNGVVDPVMGEECDGGGESATCDSDCTLAVCGDYRLNEVAGEDCDEGPEDTASCDHDCTAPACGDAHVNLPAGEECETGGESRFCDGDCTFAWCGDGTPNATAGEQCDDGNDDDEDWCLTTCVAASCEDDIQNGDEDDVDCGGDCDPCEDECDCENDCEACDGGCDACDGGGWVSLAAGWAHTCARLETGAVRCWGRGGDGALGYGNTTSIGDNEAPVGAGDVDVGGEVSQLAAGSQHTCALLDTGAVRCWGGNWVGQLGYGNTSIVGNDEAPAAAGEVDVGGVAMQIVAGGEHTCALLETGAVRCWGGNWVGQLGYGNTNDIGDDETPATAGDVPAGGGVTQIVAGGHHTCAVTTTGTVRCWGRGAEGQLGYGNTNNIGDDEAPVSAGTVDVGGFVMKLVAGLEHTCALLETGAVRCWGNGGQGRLGYGNTSTIGDDETPASAGDVDVGGYVIDLVAGTYHTCALLLSGEVRCWGSGYYGQLGYGSTNNIGDNETPVMAGDVDVGGSVMQLAAGYFHTCALLDASAVRCWGWGRFGQLGYGNMSDIGYNETPAAAGDVPYR
jgi:cysteine-rich repeat protein